MKEAELIDGSYRNYAIYTLESRAIPSIIDGMKPVHRKIMCLALQEARRKKMKVADFGSISKLGYKHGETSAQDAAVGMASDWNNNVPLLEGHGDFGSRLCHQAAAARYIYAKVSDAWDKYFDSIEVCPDHPDPEFTEPAYYLPKIPWVLINGIQGIAVGFAVNILPRSPKDVKRYCMRIIEGNRSVPETIKPTFPGFKGTVTQGSEGSKHWIVRGVYELTRNTYRITELPVGWDREKYVNFLNSCVEKGSIKDYSDLCDETGFVFEVKVTTDQKKAIEKDPYKALRLEKSLHENFTLLNENGNPMVLNSVREIVEYFLEHRLEKYQDYIEYQRNQIESNLKFLQDKEVFINGVLDGTIDLRSLNRNDLIEEIQKFATHPDSPQRLSSIPAYSFTKDSVEILIKEIDSAKVEFDKWNKETNTGFYSKVLKEI